MLPVTQPRSLALIVASYFALAGSSPAAIVDSPEQLRADAVVAEKAGRWDEAAELYLRLHALDRTRADVRDRLHSCLRHVQQIRRIRDANYRTRVLSLDLTQALNVYTEVLQKLHAAYVDRDKTTPGRLYRHGLDEWLMALDEEAFRLEHLPGVERSAVRQLAELVREQFPERTVRAVADARQAARDAALLAYRALGLNPTVAVMEFVCGACNALDEYTVYLPPGPSVDEAASLAGDLAAVGLGLAVRNGQLVVERVVPGSWAAQNFVFKEGDRLVRLNRRLPERLTAEAFVDFLRSEPGPLTEVDVLAAGEMMPRTVKLPLSLPTVVGTDLLDPDRGIGYARVLGFQRNTLQEVEEALLILHSQGLRVLVLDLRGNPGGLFETAVKLAERFLPGGVIVSTQGQLRVFNRTHVAPGGPGTWDVPLVLLIDGDTASAAEVVAGAFKDQHRATLVGQPTYGKGSMQAVVQLSTAGGVRLTLARLYTPRGTAINGVGVIPHVLEPVRDRQLEAAVEAAARLTTMRD